MPAGGATIAEFKVNFPGRFILVDHALSRAAKGGLAFLDVSGPSDASVYSASERVGVNMDAH